MQGVFSKYRVVEILISLLLVAYGFIFTSTVSAINKRVDDIEVKYKEINPTLLKIQTDLSGIKVNLEWVKQMITEKDLK